MTSVRSSRRGGVRALALALLVPLGACSLDVNQPDIVEPGKVRSKANLPTLLAGASSEFSQAFSASGDVQGYALISALFTDEYMNSDYFQTHQELDRRSVQETNSAMSSTFANLQRARTAAEAAAALYAELDPTNVGRAEALNIAGFTYVLLAEGWCSGVPFSETTADGNIVYGAPLPTDSLYARALARFGAAVTNASGDVRELNGARLGRARVLLNQGQYAAAAAEVASVPSSFEYEAFHSETFSRTSNGIFMWNNVYERYTVSDREGTNGLPFRTAGDPRSPFKDEGVFGLDNRTQLYTQQKYESRATSIPVASGIEARLIEAEADLNASNHVAMTQKLNALRSAFAPSLPPLTPPVTRDAAIDMLFSERGFWLFLTGHRQGDLRRLVRQYGRAQASVYPSGVYHKGGPIGTDVNWPLPERERNNPNYGTGCINRNA